jgi:hypothetical protein
MKHKLTTERIIFLITLWQLISVGLMAVGVWPPQIAILNTALLALFILVAKPYYSVLLLVLSIPFYVVLPNPVIANLPMWRILFVWLFIVWLVHLLINQRAWLMRVFAIQRWQSQTPMTGARLKEIVVNALKRIDSRFMPWDKVAVLFILLALLSLLIARFPMHGFKQILFLLNVYLFYVVIINVVTDFDKVKQLIRFTTYSLGIMVGLGFVQYLGTMFASPYAFWQYWAMLVSAEYYGKPLADVLAYSNSWFNYSGGDKSLRMFGILPDTHAFGVICIFLLAYLLPKLNLNLKENFKAHHWYVPAGVLVTCFALMANGTRGIWVAMLAPFALALFMIVRRVLPEFMKLLLGVYVLVVLLFVASPYITQGLNFIRTYDVKDDFLGRAESIYDLNESSNVGRLEIWKNSAKFAAVHPFGVGYGNFIVSITNKISQKATYEDVSEAKNLRYNLPQAFVTAHSLYLQLLVELGFAGLLAFILLWWEYFERLIVFVKKHAGNLNSSAYLAISIAFAFVWILAYGVFDLTILNDRVLQYLFISMAISGLIFAKYSSTPKLIDEPAGEVL